MSPTLSVSEFLASVNQTLEYAYTAIHVEGEVSSYKVNQGKFVFFDLKDASGTLGCFMTVWQLRTPIEDGMKIIVTGQPKVTPWGKFSLTVQRLRPSGEGNIKKSQALLRAKLEAEGLFADERKRTLPTIPRTVAVVSSTQAAGYADFIKILEQRWGGLDIQVAHTQVQGEVAADQMIRAIEHFNQQPEPADVLVLLRGGGSADDLASFDDEKLVRAVAGSRIPTLVGIGHETDTSLVDLAADVRAATPSNAAQLLVPDRREIVDSVHHVLRAMMVAAERAIDTLRTDTQSWIREMYEATLRCLDEVARDLAQQRTALRAYDPTAVLARGYAIVRGQIAVGERIDIETKNKYIQAEVRNVKDNQNNS